MDNRTTYVSQFTPSANGATGLAFAAPN